MERFTQINGAREYFIEDYYGRHYGNEITKLGKIEDLLDQYNVKDLEELDKLLTMATSYEELSKQVGCPLDVFIKLVKQVKINFNGTMTGYFVFYNLFHKRFEIRNEETMDLFPLADYKKKFWLKEDKSE
jgi:hypothetical protein